MKQIGVGGSLNVDDEFASCIRRYVGIARAKSNSRGSKRWEPAKQVSLSVCLSVYLGVSVTVFA